jgi:hypothetical protein
MAGSVWLRQAIRSTIERITNGPSGFLQEFSFLAVKEPTG